MVLYVTKYSCHFYWMWFFFVDQQKNKNKNQCLQIVWLVYDFLTFCCCWCCCCCSCLVVFKFKGEIVIPKHNVMQNVLTVIWPGWFYQVEQAISICHLTGLKIGVSGIQGASFHPYTYILFYVVLSFQISGLGLTEKCCVVWFVQFSLPIPDLQELTAVARKTLGQGPLLAQPVNVEISLKTKENNAYIFLEVWSISLDVDNWDPEVKVR